MSKAVCWKCPQDGCLLMDDSDFWICESRGGNGSYSDVFDDEDVEMIRGVYGSYSNVLEMQDVEMTAVSMLCVEEHNIRFILCIQCYILI